MGNTTLGAVIEVDKLSFDPKRITIHWNDGHRSIYDAVWLRDNCPSDRDSRTGQRLVDIADLPEEPAIGAVSQNSGAAVLITWRGEPKSSWYPLEWLRKHCYCVEHRQSRKRAPFVWRADQSGHLLWMKYAEVLASKPAEARWLRAIADQGIAFLRGVPTQDGHVLEVARLVGYVRETNYGRIFDVRSVANPNNLAYSDRGLGVHTDNPYREPVPGLQILHCLQADEEGGESLFVDGFAVAVELQVQDPQAFDTLTRVRVPFAFRDDCADLRAERRLLELSSDGKIAAIHYNSRSILPVCLPSEELVAFYPAYRAFARLLRDPRFEFRVKLGSGDLVAFNNRRILHGRTAFSSAAGRWLQGCYLDWDGLMSNLAVLERKL
ncbi:MAG TPA: TauD/TfdA family dioxygenase [Bryobacteraceae bacterium]|nr:TauD/TfdA family dioxygenase [Bryobacteraceae bacterium]